MANLKELKARIDIIDVLEKIGARFARDDFAAYVDEVKVYCPFCDDNDSAAPAASANPLKGLYFCYACGLGGTIIDVAAAHLGTGIFGSIKWLEENWPKEGKEDEDPWSGV